MERIDSIIKKMEQKYPKNMETESIAIEVMKKISNIERAILSSSNITCKEETEELNKYAKFNENFVLETNENIDEIKFDKSLKSWQDCLQFKNKDFTQIMNKMDTEYNVINNKINECLKDCSFNSNSKSNEDLEKCFYNCMLNHEKNFKLTTQKYHEIFNEYEKKFQKYL